MIRMTQQHLRGLTPDQALRLHLIEQLMPHRGNRPVGAVIAEANTIQNLMYQMKDYPDGNVEKVNVR